MKDLIKPAEQNWARWMERASMVRTAATLSTNVVPYTLVIVSCIWLSMVLLANPSGEFPLNDDWSYGRAVQTLIETGRLELTGFTSMPLIAQVFWGALFCVPFGFSFTALRVSTITLGLFGIFTTYWIFQELKTKHSLAVIAMIVLATNPLYFQLSLTFMTDVPFFTFSMLAVLFFLRALRTENLEDIIAGYVFSLIAILIRQLAITIPLSFLVSYLVKNHASRKTFVNAFFPTITFFCFLFAFPIMMRRTIGLPALYNRSYEPILESAPQGWIQLPLVFGDRIFIEILYLGLFLLPFLIGLEAIKSTISHLQAKRVSRYAWIAAFAATSAYLVWKHRFMPLTGNLLLDVGLGPLSLRDTYLLKLLHWPTAPKTFWLIVTVASALGSVLLVRRGSSISIKPLRSFTSAFSTQNSRTLFLLSAVILYSLFIGIAGFLDRYLIWLLPLLMAVISIPIHSVRLYASTFPLVVAAILISLYALFALTSTHDYIAWNRARWQALTDLMQKDHISYQNIDGGFEFNGWYGYDAKFQPDSSKSWWWVKDDLYVISLGSIPGYAAIKQYPFNRWMPFGQGNIFLLKRVDAAINERAVVR